MRGTLIKNVNVIIVLLRLQSHLVVIHHYVMKDYNQNTHSCCPKDI